MPILTLQRRMMELGRLRMGDKKGTGNDPRRKLSEWRLTSASRVLLESAAEVYGGEVQPWEDAPDEGYFELYTESSALDIIIPPVFSAQDGTPTAPYSQWLELWSGGGRLRQCDGEVEGVSGKPCLCRAEEREPGDANDKKACKFKTRLSVILPKVPGVGIWTMTTQGVNAAILLPGTLDLLIRAANDREFIPASLRIEPRTKKIDGQTHKFSVPVIDVPGLKMGELPGIAGPPAINPPQAQPPKPALPEGAPDPPADTPLENDRPEWGTEHPDTADFEPPEHIALTERLKELADQLEVAKATDEAIRSNRSTNGGDLDKHITWLKQQVTRAENSLKAKGSQETLV